MMAKLTVSVELDAEDATIGRSYAIADVFYQGNGTQGGDLLGVPVKLQSNRQTEIGELPAGEYVVQLRLASGERATKNVSMAGEDDHALTFDLRRLSSPKPTFSTAEMQAALTKARELMLSTRVFSPDNPATDLMRIRGVGPALAKVLVDRGVNSVVDVARMSPREIGWLGQSASSIRGTVQRFDITKGAADVMSSTDLGGGEFEMGFASGLQTGGYGTGLFPGLLAGGEGGPTFLDQVVLMGEQTLVFDSLPAEDAADDTVAAASLRPFELDDTEGDAGAVWARIEALANSDDSERSPDDLVQALGRWDGDPAILEGDIEGERSAITIVKGAELLQLAPNSSRLHAIINDGHVAWLAPLPLPWRIPDDPRECTLSIVADRGEPWMTSVSMLPQDPVAGGLIEFLQSGDVTATLAILDAATERLYEKILNPFAAAAGALVLVQSKRWAPQVLERRTDLGSGAKWEEWVSNLCQWKGWLPDGFVLHAWLNLLDDNGDEQLAREHLLTAVKLGLPAYSGCFRLLVDGLRTLQSRNRLGDAEVDAALRTLDATALRIDPRQVFTMVRLTDPPSRSFSTLSADIST
jgi:predicted flap endonuclease-1-like 5' DNA nuclease